MNSSGPFFDDKNRPIARESVILYADLLGYKSAIKRWSEAPHESQLLGKVYDALRESFKLVEDPSGAKWFAKMISDTLVVTFPIIKVGGRIGSMEIGFALSFACQFQLAMMTHGLLVRGGICFGEVHASDLLVFPSEAVQTELDQMERISHYPRVVLSDSAIDFMLHRIDQRDSSTIKRFVWQDADGILFVNYMHPIGTSADDSRIIIVKSQKTLVETCLIEFQNYQGIRAKYAWVANYHNRFCKFARRFDSPDFLIAL